MPGWDWVPCRLQDLHWSRPFALIKENSFGGIQFKVFKDLRELEGRRKAIELKLVKICVAINSY